MKRPLVVLLVLLVAGAGYGALRLAQPTAAPHYTGFVEGEERLIRAEVAGRILDVKHREGARVAAGEVLALLDDRGMQAQLESRRQELAVLDAQIRTQVERVALAETTWQREVSARSAGLRRAQATAGVAARSFERQQKLLGTGVSTEQQVDDARARRDEAQSGLEEAQAVLANVEGQERNITLARQQLDTLRAERTLVERRLEELDITLAKYTIRAPAVDTIVQTQFAWPGELAQPGTAILGVLDPLDKYVLVYVPVSDLAAFRVGRRVSIELDSQPGRRFPGEVSFVAAEANFTPQKIETRSDRIGQVYRAKVRLLEGVEDMQPGTEGDVFLEPAA